MTAEQLALIAGAILSLLVSYIPGLNEKFAGLDSIYKRLIMLALIVLTAVGIFGLSCAGIYDYVTCDQVGAWYLLELIALAAMANQSAYLLSPESKAVRSAKLERALNGEPHGQG
jgi:hypothetical protein